MRAALEEVAARAAAPVMKGAVAALEAELAGMRAAAREHDGHAFVVHDVAFHRAIVAASGNRTLQELWGSLHVDLRTTITLVRRAEDLGAVAESHVVVMEALAAGAPERAARALREHIESFADWVQPPGA